MDGDFAPHGLRHVIQVRLIPPWQDDLLQPSPVGRQEFLLDATDWQNFALQRDLARHAHLLAHWTPGQQTGKRGDHCDACRWAILRHSPRGDMYVELLALKGRGVDTEISGVRT